MKLTRRWHPNLYLSSTNKEKRDKDTATKTAETTTTVITKISSVSGPDAYVDDEKKVEAKVESSNDVTS